MGVPDTAKCQRQQFPIVPLFFINFSNCKFSYCIIAPNHRCQRNAVPKDGNVAIDFNRNIVDIRFLVPNAAGFNDIELLVFISGSTHVNKF